MNKTNFVFGYGSTTIKCGVGSYSLALKSELKLNNLCGNVNFINFEPTRLIEWIFFFKKLFRKDIFHYQYPLESWGKSILPGILPFVAKILRSKVIVVITLHEWQRMHILRRLSIIPAVAVADHIIFVSSQEINSFSRSLTGRYRNYAGKKQSIIPIGVNVSIPFLNEIDVEKKRQLLIQSGFDFIMGYFGFLYEAKQPYKMIDILVSLKQLGLKVKLVLCGDFPDGHDLERTKFLDYIKSKEVSDAVELMGYVADEKLLRQTLSVCDINLQLYDDGVSTRRGSFWYALDSGFKILTTYPKILDEFSAATTYDPLKDKNVMFIDVDTSASDISRLLIEELNKWVVPVQRNIAPKWNEIAAEHLLLYKSLNG